MELYNYFRSSASYRVRIAMALKGLTFDYKPVHLARNEQFQESYAAVSASRLVPLLRDGEASVTQSMAIIEYLDEIHPTPSLLPGDALSRAYIRALSQDIACEIHPLNNLRVLRYLVKDLGVTDENKTRWYRHWVESGLGVVEHRLAQEGRAGRFCFGETPTMADCLLVPQVFNAQRFDCRLDHVPTVMRIHDHCMTLEAFRLTHPDACPDAA
ncbi:maleylacetoacetate isomerase [Roseateles amylovorans]|uniref:Maleylacetoacetate isomerase n=1 Tax=Roseateles amylovorans TaxID=2978473 RepID=A0ABY6AWE6_9BURK|nr:maleylacetoacetate isomerase [Roseateles amylovorans]UXH77258.1 maleylacetoacetate isomerase [Roseateles amylovorans]